MIHSLAVLSFAGSVFRAAALGLLGLFLLTSIPPAAIHMGAYVAQAVAGAGEDSAGALRRVQGDAFVDAIERIRWVLPRDGEYLLVNGAADVQQGQLKEFQAITASVIGGSLLTGGYGTVVGAAFGALIFGMVSQGIFFTGADADWFQAFLGAMLLSAVLVNRYFTRSAQAAS